MKKIIPAHTLLRVLSFVPLLSMAAFPAFGRQSSVCGCFICALSASCAILLFYPIPSQKLRLPLSFSLACIIWTVSALISGVAWRTAVIVNCLLPLAYSFFSFHGSYSKVRFLFAPNNVMALVRIFARLFWSYALLCLSVILLYPVPDTPSWVLLAVFTLYFVFLYVRAYSSRTFFVSFTFERQIAEIASSEIRNVRVEGYVDNDRMRGIYKQILELMEQKRPYLDPDFSVYDLSQMTYTNKSYISRIVNLYSGRNFCQFINYYRVQYAAGIAKEDPAVKVTELALMSGFNSTVTFNAAFRTYIGMSPGEYLLRVIDDRHGVPDSL